MGEGIHIGEIAQSAGLTTQAIRFYEKRGLIGSAARTLGGYRVYSPETRERVRFIKRAQALGFSLDEIREILRLKYGGQSPCDCVREMLTKKLAALREQMAEMEKMRREIQFSLRASRRLSRLPHEASLICPLIQMPTSLRTTNSGKKGGERR